MGQDKQRQILFAAKTDNIKKFSELADSDKELLRLRWGRFPLLSVCYLYGSTKIIKKYQNSLISITEYTALPEDYELYKKFKAKAGRCLRLYASGDTAVSPQEMLAILDNPEYLTKVYPKQQNTAKITRNIEKIFTTLHGREVKRTADGMAISRKKLSGKRKLYALTAIILACVMMALSGGAWGIVRFFGEGSAKNPFKISSERQLIEAFEREEKHFVLAKDITLTSSWRPKEFEGSLDGNGHTVYAKGKMKEGFLSKLTGSVSNINFDFGKIKADIADNTAFVVKSNFGTIKNISVEVSAELAETNEEQSVYVSCLAHENNGEINGCKISAQITMTGNGASDTFLCGVAAINNGSVIDCSTAQGSVFSADTVDLAGIAAQNSNTGTVSRCVNNAEIFQTSSNSNWLPNSAGVVLTNSGEINNCVNNGKVTSVSTATENLLEAYAGGIACVNNNKIRKSKNTGDITAKAEVFHVYAGGVAAVADSYSSIENSCSYGKITVALADKDNNIFLFAGGIAGRGYGAIKDCFTACQFETDNPQAQYKAFAGGITGVAYYYSTVSQNNYYTVKSASIYGIACILLDNVIYRNDRDDDSIQRVENIEQLKTKEVYWE